VVANKSGGMNRQTEARLLSFVENRLNEGRRALTVAWFGGEPLLALPLLERLSAGFIAACSHRGVVYAAQLVTNGTLLTNSVVQRLRRIGVSQVQVTLDGLRGTHDARRRWNKSRRSSFDDIMDGLRATIGQIPVRLRVNVDDRNISDAMDLLALFAKEGWLNPATRFVPYVARVLDYTAASACAAGHVCEPGRFEALQRRWFESLRSYGLDVTMRALYGFPEPRAVTCNAVSGSGYVVAPDGTLYRCSFDADDRTRASGSLTEGVQPVEAEQFWRMYDPFQRRTCRECEALPSCLGFCPRNFRDKRMKFIDENCRYFRETEPRIVRHHLSLMLDVQARRSRAT